MDNIIKLSDLKDSVTKGDDELYQKIKNYLIFIGQGQNVDEEPEIEIYAFYQRLKQLRAMADDIIDHIEKAEFWVTREL